MRFVPFALQPDLLDPGVFVREVSRLSAFAKEVDPAPAASEAQQRPYGKGPSR